MSRIPVHNILPAPAENPATSQVSEFKYLVKDKPTPLLQKILDFRKNKERQLLERHGLPEDVYRVYYDVQEHEVDKIAIKRSDFKSKAESSPKYLEAKVYAEALTRLKELEASDRVNPDRTLAGFIDSCLETMVDDRNKRAMLAARLGDTSICSKDFVSFSSSADDALFQANYITTEIELSDRVGSFELRGERLREVMRKYEYDTLNALFSQLYLTEYDHQMVYLVSSLINIDILAKCEEYNLPQDRIDNIIRRFENLAFRGVPLKKLVPHYFISE